MSNLKKTISMSGIILAVVLVAGCYQRSYDVLPNKIGSTAKYGALGPPSGHVAACGIEGGPVYDWVKPSGYNCHQYVRGVLIAVGRANTTTGQPNYGEDFGNMSASPIYYDPNFIRVCSFNDAQAISHLPTSGGGMADHSSFIAKSESGSTLYPYSFPGGPYVYESPSPLNYGNGCDYEFYAAIPDVKILTPVINGTNYTFTLDKNNRSFILDDGASTWTIPSGFHAVGTPDGTTLTIAPDTNTASGSYTVTATIRTSALTGSCPNGVMGANAANNFVPTRQYQFSYTATAPPVDCTGTLDGGSLNTVNSVTYGTHYVVMNVYPITWVQTSGSGSYSTSDFGHHVTINVSSGAASFHVYGQGCDMNYTFYPH